LEKKSIFNELKSFISICDKFQLSEWRGYSVKYCNNLSQAIYFAAKDIKVSLSILDDINIEVSGLAEVSKGKINPDLYTIEMATFREKIKIVIFRFFRMKRKCL